MTGRVGLECLTAVETRALPYIALPLDMAAHRLGVSHSRVRQLWASITRKVGAANTKGAIVLVVQAGVKLEILSAPSNAAEKS